ncbi:DUF6037 family protein [Bacillus sp. 17RED48]|uniref:DUF6037 family protein n=1 Tax=Bacillus sp. 17RED48 TaxID=2778093 RepID=UPI001C9B227B|nr:DUF6037 family protein [Bacillus sp. 17RED48]
MAIFSNLKDLKRNMEEKGWCIDSFLFKYKQEEFIVLVKLYTKDEAKPKYALLKLEFLRRGDVNDKLLVPANSQDFLVDGKTLREYFNIERGEKLGDKIQQLKHLFSTCIPKKVNEKKTKDQEAAMVHSLSRSDSEDPNKIYCNSVRRNGKKADGISLKERSPFNDNKTRILRPELYEELKRDIYLSFVYYSDPNRLKTTGEILYNWTKNNGI